MMKDGLDKSMQRAYPAGCFCDDPTEIRVARIILDEGMDCSCLE